MTWLQVLLGIPATFSATTALAWLSPVRLDARAIPMFMAIVALLVLALPMKAEMALAVVPLVSYAQAKLGISLAAHDPVNYSPAAGKARTMIDHTVVAVRGRTKPPVPIEVQEFAARPYPSPADAVPDGDAPGDDATVTNGDTGADGEPAVDDKVAALQGKIQTMASQLPGQRPRPNFRTNTPAHPVPQYVPRL